jgi:hypothetical protein
MTNNTQYAYVVTSDRGIEEIFTSNRELTLTEQIQSVVKASECDNYTIDQVVDDPDIGDCTITLTLFWKYGRTATEIIRRFVPIQIA